MGIECVFDDNMGRLLRKNEKGETSNDDIDSEIRLISSPKKMNRSYGTGHDAGMFKRKQFTSRRKLALPMTD